MKSRIQTVEQLKKIVSDKLQDEFNQRYQEATLEGAIQGIAFVMYVLETAQGWKQKRQTKLFEDMLAITDLPSLVPWLKSYEALDIKKHIETEYGIDFCKLLTRVEASSPD
jgi:hypothetical protein